LANQNFKVKNGLEVGPNSSGIGTIITTTSSGLVGVAITNPTYTLTVAGSGTSTTQLYVTGVSTHIGISTFTGTLFANQVSVVGPSTLGGITTSTNSLFANQVSVVGPSTLGGITTSTGTLFVNQLGVVGPSTLGGITTSTGTLFSRQLSVVGPSTLGGITTSTGTLFANQVSVVGPSTLGGITTSTNSLFANQFSVVGPSTLGGITTSTNSLFANQFSVAGVSTFRNDLKLPDNVGLEVGTGVGSTDYDFRIYHDGSHTYLDQQNTAGDIYIRNTRTSGSILLQADNSSGTLRTVFAATGASSGAELYFDGTKRFETLTGGASVSAGYLLVNTTSLTGTASQNLQVSGHAYISGNLGIGVTLPSASDLHVLVGSQTSGVPAAIIQSSDTSVGSNNILLDLDFSGDASATGGFFVRVQDADTVIGGIQLASSTTVSYTGTSDYRLKTNIQPLTGSVDRVLSLKPCTFDWIINGDSAEGFIAHELQEVVPLAVTGTKDEVDEDGNILPQGVDPRHVVPVLTAALQEALKRIEELETKVAKLKTK